MMLWGLMIVTFIFCAVSAFPTKWCMQLWEASVRLWRGHVRRALEHELARRAAGTGFVAEQKFFARGVGLAVDKTHGLLFLAAPEGSRLSSAILPFTALHAVSAGEASDNGFYDYYVDLTLRDAVQPRWRLLCGENPALAAEVKQLLTDGVMQA
jgi:hypothetical protein